MSWYWSRCACVTIFFFLFIQSLPSIVICFVFLRFGWVLYDFFSYMERMSCYCTKSCWTDLSGVTNWPPVFAMANLYMFELKFVSTFLTHNHEYPRGFDPVSAKGSAFSRKDIKSVKSAHSFLNILPLRLSDSCRQEDVHLVMSSPFT